MVPGTTNILPSVYIVIVVMFIITFSDKVSDETVKSPTCNNNNRTSAGLSIHLSVYTVYICMTSEGAIYTHVVNNDLVYPWSSYKVRDF